jgi:hypothetical protein
MSVLGTTIQSCNIRSQQVGLNIVKSKHPCIRSSKCNHLAMQTISKNIAQPSFVQSSHPQASQLSPLCSCNVSTTSKIPCPSFAVVLQGILIGERIVSSSTARRVENY